MNRSLSFSLLALACIAFAPAAQAQTTLDFENLSNPSNPGGMNGQGNSVTQNGFTITTQVIGSNQLGSISPNAVNPFNYIGSVALNVSSNNQFATLTQNNGNPFTINSIDIANALRQSAFAGGVTVTFVGNIQGGGSVTQSYTHGANNNLETVTFGSNFTNLASFTINQVPPNNQFDNIVLNRVAAVPEPGSVALLVGMGISGAGFLVRRKASKKSA